MLKKLASFLGYVQNVSTDILSQTNETVAVTVNITKETVTLTKELTNLTKALTKTVKNLEKVIVLSERFIVGRNGVYALKKGVKYIGSSTELTELSTGTIVKSITWIGIASNLVQIGVVLLNPAISGAPIVAGTIGTLALELAPILAKKAKSKLVYKSVAIGCGIFKVLVLHKKP
jgi:hypothetical protein